MVPGTSRAVQRSKDWRERNKAERLAEFELADAIRAVPENGKLKSGQMLDGLDLADDRQGGCGVNV